MFLVVFTIVAREVPAVEETLLDICCYSLQWKKYHSEHENEENILGTLIFFYRFCFTANRKVGRPFVFILVIPEECEDFITIPG